MSYKYIKSDIHASEKVFSFAKITVSKAAMIELIEESKLHYVTEYRHIPTPRISLFRQRGCMSDSFRKSALSLI